MGPNRFSIVELTGPADLASLFAGQQLLGRRSCRRSGVKFDQFPSPMRHPLLVVSRDFSVPFYLHCFAAPKTAHAKVSYFVYSYEVTNMPEANNDLGAPASIRHSSPNVARDARRHDRTNRRPRRPAIEPAKRPVVAHVGPEPLALGVPFLASTGPGFSSRPASF